MATASGSSASHRVTKRLRPDLPLIACGKCEEMIVIKVLIFCFTFSGMALDVQDGTGRKSMLNTYKTLLHRRLRRLMRH